KHVHVLAVDIGERHTARPEALSAAARYIEQALASSGYAVRRQTYEADGVVCANLEVELLGRERAEEILLIGAHYRHRLGISRRGRQCQRRRGLDRDHSPSLGASAETDGPLRGFRERRAAALLVGSDGQRRVR